MTFEPLSAAGTATAPAPTYLFAGGCRLKITATFWIITSGRQHEALTRLDRAGAHLTTYESALFELMGDSKTENFKAVSALIKEERPNPPLPFLHVSTI